MPVAGGSGHGSEMHSVPILLVSRVLMAAACGDDDAATSAQGTNPSGTSTATTAGEQFPPRT